MPILNFQVDSVGQVGVVPRWIYIDTNDASTVISGDPGYLNGLVEGGTPLSINDMALVTTSNLPVGIYNVIYSNGNWGLQVH